MRFAVHHETHYRYSAPVVLAPHTLRLTPRPGEHLVRARTLAVRPHPVEIRDELDGSGNQVAHVAFSDVPTDELHIDSRFELDTVPAPAPVAGGLAPLPWAAVGRADSAVAAFAGALANEAAHEPLAFLDLLCRTIHARADRRIRTSGDAQSAGETLATWTGACRDLTVLFLEAARSLGMTARFCSGYQSAADTPDGRRYLHAWPEVLLPGTGWRGWDPTHGVPVVDGHVALCAAPDQAGTMPVAGSYAFSGPSLTATLDFALTIETT